MGTLITQHFTKFKSWYATRYIETLPLSEQHELFTERGARMLQEALVKHDIHGVLNVNSLAELAPLL